MSRVTLEATLGPLLVGPLLAYLSRYTEVRALGYFNEINETNYVQWLADKLVIYQV